MKQPFHPGRKRRIGGWVLLSLAVLGAVAGVGSVWYTPTAVFNGNEWIISRGWVGYRPDPTAGWKEVVGTGGLPLMGGFFAQYSNVACLWPIPLLLCTPAALLLRSGILARRRANTGACPKCAYSLAGLSADAPCPECGKTTTAHGKPNAAVLP